MRRIGRLGQLVLLGLFAHSAHAAEQVTPGWYFGASGGAATHDVSKGGAQDTIVIILGFGGGGGGIIAVPRTTLDTDSDGTGWRGLAGYRFHRNFAAELEYLDFGTSHIHETYVIDDVKLPWYVDLLNINLNNFDLTEAKRRIRLMADAFRKDGTRITENLDFDAKATKAN